MRLIRFVAALALGCAALAAAPAVRSETPAGARAPQPPPPQPPPPPGGRGGGRGRGAIQVMTLSSTAWSDGGAIPARHAQTGGEVSPPLAWSKVPDGTQSFVLIAHDVDAAVGPATDDVLQWMLWNIPASATSLPEGVPHGAQLADGTRQISATGPFYRGPGAASSGPAHHYVFELYALDTTIEVPAVGSSPAQTRAAVVAAMAGHVRAKAALVGLFKR